MELAELMDLRPQPAAGLLMMLTRRCPLRCAHCSSGSTMTAAEPDAANLLRFTGSFTAADHPETLLLTGGEPLLLPELATELAGLARAAGTRTALLTGAFFARDVGRTSGEPGARGVLPDRIRRAVDAVDHFSVSLDAFHEREVPRAGVFRVVREVLDAGTAASFHLLGTGPEDPYLADVTTAVREEFGDRVPMLVNTVRAVGRAAADARPAVGVAHDPLRALPCSMAAWPVVADDGAVVACCNQDTVDRRPVPAHLLLGHAGEDDWPTVRRRTTSSPVLRAVRTVGPTRLLARHGGPAAQATRHAGYCAGCRALGEHPEAVAGAERLASGPAGALLDQRAARRQREAGPVAYVRRHGCAPYADLVALPGTGS
ncbi:MULTISPECIES: radical SAM protein [unclassified Streptomyces]|uniref:radical SAM protein n=1 Tax=unclassified Streptomyces TaxID=2593676 RepID=UPI0022B754DD|nr:MULTISPECIES: radical SAM protein [unclassified Streptomyces]MCZ7416134.1 radical SAM protein [Streptomyces sp. WMMC897]MCZ7434058.1 radical SAM protein [Streptomyces sp. WMMC1477]